jgi:hypothetical protein
MARINPDNQEESNDKNAALKASCQHSPMVVCGVNRKVNLGQYETVDIYCGVSLPLEDFDMSDKEDLKEKLSDLAAEAFYFTSRETGERYDLIKNAIKAGREAAAEESSS